MAHRNHDLISSLPEECKSALVQFLAGKDAANLRLTSRAWRYTAGEGLFNISVAYGNGNYLITRGVLVLRPYRTYRSILDGLEKWPWMVPHIRALEVYLPDKDVDMLELAVDEYLAFSFEPWAPWKDRLADLGRDLVRGQGDWSLLHSIFSRLTHVDELHAFTQRCPFPDHETELCAFWDGILIHEDSDSDPDNWSWNAPQEFGHMYQAPRAVFLYLEILEGIKIFKTPLRTLSLDLIPMKVFGRLGSNPDLVEYLQRSLRKIERLSIGIVRSWHNALYKNNWPCLKRLRLQDFRTPDKLLQQFIVDHASSLEHVSIVGCFVGHDDRDDEISSELWGFGGDNFREMMENLKIKTKLNTFCNRFSTREGSCRCKDHEENSWELEIQNIDQLLQQGQGLSDEALLNHFLRGGCSWPMLHDNPDLLWDLDFETSWTKLPQWAPNLEEGPEEDPSHCLERLRPRPLLR